MSLSRTSTGWQATITGADSAYITELFGANVLPLAYTPAASAEEVLREIRKLNPDRHVVLA